MLFILDLSIPWFIYLFSNHTINVRSLRNLDMPAFCPQYFHIPALQYADTGQSANHDCNSCVSFSCLKAQSLSFTGRPQAGLSTQGRHDDWQNVCVTAQCDLSGTVPACLCVCMCLGLHDFVSACGQRWGQQVLCMDVWGCALLQSANPSIRESLFSAVCAVCKQRLETRIRLLMRLAWDSSFENTIT